MGCVTATAKRRRKQARNGFKHLAPRQRPKYARPDAGKSAMRLRLSVERLRQMQQRKGTKGK